MPAALFFVLYLLTGADDRYRYLPLWRRILRVVQCKRYETRLGSTPVQEIVAARSFYEADRACVMSLLLLTVIVFCAAAAVFAVLRQIPALAPVFAPEDVLHRLFGAVFGGAAGTIPGFAAGGSRGPASGAVRLLSAAFSGDDPETGLYFGAAAVFLALLYHFLFGSTVRAIDAMSGAEFEDFCAKVLRRNGYRRVLVTQASVDYGADITAYKKGEKCIEEIDPNFRIPEGMAEGLRFYDPQEEPFRIWGLAPNRKGVFCRLPEELLPTFSEGIQVLAYSLAGACVRFSTDADRMAVLWTLWGGEISPHSAPSGRNGMQLFEETDKGSVNVRNLIPALADSGRCCLAQCHDIALPGGMRHYALYLPLYNGLTALTLGFPEGASIGSGRVPAIAKPIVYYGSSITQGGCASKAGSCYTTLLARRLDAPQINLGFSGSGKGEAVMARYIASLPMSVFVMDYDHNAPDAAYLEKTYEDALAEGDRNVWFVDGETCFGTTDRDMCTVDGIHPTDLGFLRMADTLEPVLRRALHC